MANKLTIYGNTYRLGAWNAIVLKTKKSRKTGNYVMLTVTPPEFEKKWGNSVFHVIRDTRQTNENAFRKPDVLRSYNSLNGAEKGYEKVG